MDRSFDLNTTCYGAVKDVPYDIAILPWGATEPHNWHLPFMTDSILSHGVAVGAAREVWMTHGVRSLVLPPIGLGSQNPGQRELKGCLHARYETQKAILTDIVASLLAQGFDKLLIINGHGGNSFKNMVRDLAVDYPHFLIAVSQWYQVIPNDKDYFDVVGDHADEKETSVMMYLHPELVRLEEAEDGAFTPFASKALKENVAWIPRHWQKVTRCTGIGDPRAATAEKGKRYYNAVVTRYVELLHDLVYLNGYEEKKA